MPTCDEASVPPDPPDAVVQMLPLPDGERGNAVFRIVELGQYHFRSGQSPAMNRVVAFSWQNAWPEGANKPESENFTTAAAESFFRRLLMTRKQGGYGLHDLGSILATPEPTAPAASGATHKGSHTGEKPFACDYVGCSFRCTTSYGLTEHKRTHARARALPPDPQ